MPKTIQIRNVPDDLHRKLKVRAAKPTMKEWLERVSSREPVEVDEPPEVTIRRMRDADDPRDLG